MGKSKKKKRQKKKEKDVKKKKYEKLNKKETKDEKKKATKKERKRKKKLKERPLQRFIAKLKQSIILKVILFFPVFIYTVLPKAFNSHNIPTRVISHQPLNFCICIQGD